MADRDSSPRFDLSLAEFRELFESVSTWGRWGQDDQRGALNYLTADRVRAAAKLIRAGETISLSLPLDTSANVDNPAPVDHHMTELGHDPAVAGPLSFAKDYIGADYHNPSHSHIDAFCHVAVDGLLYNGRPSSSVTSDGAAMDAIDVLKDGLVGRGVLLDVPRLRGVEWLEPGEHVHTADLEAAERDEGVAVEEGDVLLVRTGHARRRLERGPWDSDAARAGLHPTVATFLAERRVSALGSDGNNDTAPSTTESIDFPIHALTLNAIGIHLLDYLWLDDLAAACERAERWEFMLAAAPLRLLGGTGSPLNPIAIL